MESGLRLVGLFFHPGEKYSSSHKHMGHESKESKVKNINSKK